MRERHTEAVLNTAHSISHLGAGLSVALNVATDGNLTRGWTSEPPMHEVVLRRQAYCL